MTDLIKTEPEFEWWYVIAWSVLLVVLVFLVGLAAHLFIRLLLAGWDLAA